PPTTEDALNDTASGGRMRSCCASEEPASRTVIFAVCGALTSDVSISNEPVLRPDCTVTLAGVFAASFSEEIWTTDPGAGAVAPSVTVAVTVAPPAAGEGLKSRPVIAGLLDGFSCSVACAVLPLPDAEMSPLCATRTGLA